MSSPQIQLALWVSQPMLQAAIALVAYRRKLHKKFPAFFTYLLAQLLMFAIGFPVYLLTGYSTAYTDVYWISVAINVVLEFRIIYEIFSDVFRPYPALKDLSTSLFQWAAVVMILVSVVMISVSPGWNDPLTRAILVVQRCVRVVQCGLVIFLLAFCKQLKVSRRRQSFGIALGFGLFAGAELLSFALFSGSHLHGQIADTLNMTVYNVGMLVWLTYALVHAAETSVPMLVPQRWDEALTELRPQAEIDESLIPMFEHMVDRALSKSHDRA